MGAALALGGALAPPLAVAPALAKTGGVVAALLAAGAVLAPRERLRAWAMLGAIVVTPLLLLGQVYDTPQFATFRHHPLGAVALGALVVAALLVGGAALRRRPALLPVLAIAALPFRIPIQSGGSTANLLVPLYVVVGAGAIAYIVPRLRLGPEVEAERPATPLAVALLGFVVLYAVQALYTADLRNAVNQLAFFFVPFSLLFALLRQVRWTPRLLAWCAGVAVGLALTFTAIGFVEYATRRLLFNPKVIDANEFTSYFRVNSLFFDPNIYGRFLALVMLLLAAVLLWTRGRRPAAACALALAVLWGGLVLSFSQSSFAALLVGLAVLAAVRWDARRTAMVCGAVLAAAILVVVAAPDAVKLSLGSQRSINRATSGRFDLVQGGVDQWRARPVFGWGAGSFARVYRRRERRSRERAVSASHTIPITVAAEQGVIGLAAYLAVLATAFALLVRGVRGTRDGPLRPYLLAAFAALVLHTLLYAAFLEDPLTWTLLGTAAALPDPPP
jgi:O-antigen ligase